MADEYGIMPLAADGDLDASVGTLKINIDKSSISSYRVYFDDVRQGTTYSNDETFENVPINTYVEIEVRSFKDGYYHVLTESANDNNQISFVFEEDVTINVEAVESDYTPTTTFSETKTSIIFTIKSAYDYEDCEIYFGTAIDLDDSDSYDYDSTTVNSRGQASITFSNLKANTKYEYIIRLYNGDNINDKEFSGTTSTASIILPTVTANFGEGSVLTTATSAILTIKIADELCEEYRVILDDDTIIDWTDVPTDGDSFSETLENLTHNTEYTVEIQVRGAQIGNIIKSETLKFKTLNGYTTYINLVNMSSAKVTSDIETKVLSSGQSILVIPNKMFTISDFSFNSNDCGSDAKGNSYSWPYSYPIAVTGEVSDIIESDSEEYKVTKNNESYTFTAYPKFWSWDDANTQPVAKQPTTSYSAKDWNKMISCLDTWLQFQGYKATAGTFLPQDSSYAFTKSVYNTARAGLIKVFTIPKATPIMDEVESGLARQTSVSASKLINFGNIMCYNNLLPKEEEKE